MTNTKHLQIARAAGKEHGHEDAVLWVFSGLTDNESIIRVDDGIKADDDEIVSQLPNPENSGRTYTPTAIFVGEKARGEDSPYSYYLDLCEAYDTAYTTAVKKYIDVVARAIKEGEL